MADLEDFAGFEAGFHLITSADCLPVGITQSISTLTSIVPEFSEEPARSDGGQDNPGGAK